jgi:hypothetical protein
MHRSVFSHAGSYGALKKKLPAGHPELVSAQRGLITAQLEEHIRSVLAQAPKLTREQVSGLHAIMLESGK